MDVVLQFPSFGELSDLGCDADGTWNDTMNV
jgi:hypothetical protein